MLAIIALGSTMMYGQSLRTWVSGVGDDANPCSRTAPCKTFAGAIPKTADGGELDALDPGNFGAVTITRPITIDGGGGQVASTLVTGQGGGIVVAAQPNDVVVLRNIRLEGHKETNPNGIEFRSGKHLSIENVYISGGFHICIASFPQNSASVHILNSVIENCDFGFIATSLTGNALTVAIDNSAFFFTSEGILSSGNTQVVINRSVIDHASSFAIVTGTANGSSAQVTIDHCDISHNGTALFASGGDNFIADSKVAFNKVAFAGSTNFTFGTNRVHSNGNFGTAPTRMKQQ